ncbi:MAG: NADH-quinone oxidoreductase subunit C [Myxococcota bacterium]
MHLIAVPAPIVVVQRPRGGLFAAVRGVPVWLRALTRGGAVARRRLAPAAEPPSIAPASPNELEALRTGLVERGSIGRDAGGELEAEVAAAQSAALLRGLRDDPPFGFDVLDDLTVVDRLPAVPRFEVVYFLRASRSGLRLRVRVPVEGEPPELDSVASIWPSADWLEREARDLFGLRFRGHPGLHPILLPPDFVGAPLRRDFLKAASPDDPIEPAEPAADAEREARADGAPTGGATVVDAGEGSRS